MTLAVAVVDGAPDARERRVDSTPRPYQIFGRSPRYAGTYSGGPRYRDAVHDEGTGWTWLLGTFALGGSPRRSAARCPRSTNPVRPSVRLTQGTAKGKAS